ncbi:MAG: fibronectin type III domain-containing protein [Patescibacteria group bacterium]
MTTRKFTNMSAMDDYEFTFNSPFTVHPGVNYQLVLWLTDKNEADLSGTFYWRVSTDASCYPDGYIKINTINDYPALDFGFQVYGTKASVPADGDNPSDQTEETTGSTPSENVSSSIAKPTSLAAAYVSDSTPKGVKLTWKASTTTDIDGYRIYRSTVKGKSYSRIGQVEKTKLEFVDQAAEASQTYYYVVRAYKASDESASSNEASLQVPADAAPISPQNLHVVSFTDSKIKVAWDKNPESNITAYTLVIYKGDNVVETVTLPVASTENIFSNLSANTDYRITVLASNDKGISSSVSEITQKTAAGATQVSAGKFEMTTLTWILSGIAVLLIGTLILLILRRKRLAKKIIR